MIYTIKPTRKASENKKSTPAVKLHAHSDRTTYIIDAVTRAVENDLLHRQDFFLSEKDFDAFKQMLDASPKEIPSLKALLKEKAPWEK